MMMGGNTREACALTVLTSVLSTSHTNHVVIDAGFKTFGCESMIAQRDKPGFFWNGKPSWGSIQDRKDLWFGRVGAAGGLIYYMESANKDLKLGDRLEIVPNNATMVVNIHEKIYGVRNGVIEKEILVTGRAKGS
jgi:D-serine deaminase-like pyridoxal phosphate-dependent protein